MPNQRPAPDEEAWRNAKRICRLSARQVEMAQRLGMNPRNLPSLRPSPKERWKLPVSEFSNSATRQPSTGVVATDLDADVSDRFRDPAWQLSDLACYLVNLADDLRRCLAHGSIDPEVLPQVREELGEIAKALDAGAPISPVPAIPVPSGSKRRVFSRRDDQAQHSRR